MLASDSNDDVIPRIADLISNQIVDKEKLRTEIRNEIIQSWKNTGINVTKFIMTASAIAIGTMALYCATSAVLNLEIVYWADMLTAPTYNLLVLGSSFTTSAGLVNIGSKATSHSYNAIKSKVEPLISSCYNKVKNISEQIASYCKTNIRITSKKLSDIFYQNTGIDKKTLTPVFSKLLESAKLAKYLNNASVITNLAIAALGADIFASKARFCNAPSNTDAIIQTIATLIVGAAALSKLHDLYKTYKIRPSQQVSKLSEKKKNIYEKNSRWSARNISNSSDSIEKGYGHL